MTSYPGSHRFHHYCVSYLLSCLDPGNLRLSQFNLCPCLTGHYRPPILKRYIQAVECGRGELASTTLGTSLSKAHLRFSDAHLATDTALLVAGYSQSCILTIYHYHTIVYLAWMSSSIHLLTLVVSRGYFRSQKTVLQLGLIGMTVLFVLLCVAICLAGSPAWPVALGVIGPAELYLDSSVSCSWREGNFQNITPDAYLALTLVTSAWGS